MILIFGGVYQGKLDYALTRFGLTKADVHFCAEGDTACPAGAKAVYEIDKWVLALLRAQVDAGERADEFIARNGEAIVIGNDISCGVVPVDPLLRKWREETGRLFGRLAALSTEVVRVYCGIPTTLSHTAPEISI